MNLVQMKEANNNNLGLVDSFNGRGCFMSVDARRGRASCSAREAVAVGSAFGGPQDMMPESTVDEMGRIRERGGTVRHMLQRGLLGFFRADSNQVVPDSFLQNHEMAGDLTQKINFIGGAGRESL